MDDQRLGVADVGQQREDLDVVDEPPAGLDAALDPEGHDPAEAAGEVALGELVRRMRLETRVADPGHLGPGLQPLGDRERVLAVAGDPQRQRLEALQEEERVERAERGADVAQALDAQLEDEREVAEGGRVADAVVRRIRVDEVLLEPLAGGPVERAAVDDDAADRGAVAADPLRRRVDDDVRAVLDRLGEQGSEGVVDDDRHAPGVGHVGDRGEVVDVEPRVADELEEDRLGLLVDGAPEGRRVGAVDVGRRDADLGQGVGEQVVGAAVERRRRHDVVAGAGEVEDRQRLGRLAGCESERGHAALERGDALLEDVGRRVHDPGVDVPELLEPEQPGGVGGVVEDVAGRGVDRDGAGVRRGVGLLARVEGPGLGAEGGGIEFGHVVLSSVDG